MANKGQMFPKKMGVFPKKNSACFPKECILLCGRRGNCTPDGLGGMLSHVAFVVLVAAAVVEGAAAAEGTYFAAGEQMALMLQHDDALLGVSYISFLYCSQLLFHYDLLALVDIHADGCGLLVELAPVDGEKSRGRFS